MNSVLCPGRGCGMTLAVTPQMLGQTLRCPKCKQQFRVPAAAATPLPAALAQPSQAVQAAVPHPHAAPRQIGRFQVRAHLGSGAFGTVYRAYDPQLDREVALKVALPGTLNDPARRERFLREARASAQLRHPHIIPLFEAGTEPTPYLASAYVEGRTLEAALGGKPMDVREAARIVRDLAEALAYAHGLGIVHRDVKPANVMLDPKGVPHLLDFGLAHRQEGEEKMTRAGELLGTPAYMAPELVTAPEPGAKPATDQYALGVVLYELLTGQTPFEGPAEVVLYQAINNEMPRPSRGRPGLSRDLETICLKAMARRSEERYGSCQEMADDLRRWLEGEPIRARRLGVGERLVRWCRRNPAVAGLTAAVTVSLVLGTVVALTLAAVARQEAGRAEAALKQATGEKQRAETALKQASEEKERAKEAAARAQEQKRRAEDAATKAKQEQERAETASTQARQEKERANQQTEIAKKEEAQARAQRDKVEWLGYAHQIQMAQREWLEQNLSSMQSHLKACPPKLRGWEYQYLSALLKRSVQSFGGHTSGVTSVAFSPDGKRIASGSLDKTVKVWEAQTGQQALSLKGHTHYVYSVAFSPDGKRIASGSEDYTVKVWDAQTGQQALSLKGHSGSVYSVCFSPDGKRIASGSKDKTVKVWDAQTGQQQLSLKGHTGTVTSVAFSPDGKRLLSGNGEFNKPGEVKVWDAQAGQEALTLKGHTNVVSSVAFSPDGKRIASGSADKKVKVWDAQTGQEVLTLSGHTNVVSSVAFSPDGKRLASGSYDQTVKVWDAASGQEAFSLKGHTSDVTSVCFSPDGKRIVSGSWDKTVKVWDAHIGQEALTLKGHTNVVSSVAFSPDGKRIASGGSGDYDFRTRKFGGELKVWDAQTGQEALSLKGHTDGVNSVAFSPDGKRIASGSKGYNPGTRLFWGEVRVWDARTGQQALTLKGHTLPVTCVAFSPDGKRLASASQDKTVKVWDAQTGQQQLTLKGHTGPVLSVCFSPDGKRIASGSAGAYGNKPGELKVWDAQTGREALSLKGDTGTVTSVGFSPDGKCIASGSGGGDRTPGEVKVWDAATGQQALTLKGHTLPVRSVCFSPDGKRIVSASGYPDLEPGKTRGDVRVWDVQTGQLALTLKGHTWPVLSVAFSPDGKRIASGSSGFDPKRQKGWGEVKVWDSSGFEGP